jgi:hypothetical protein
MNFWSSKAMRDLCYRPLMMSPGHDQKGPLTRFATWNKTRISSKPSKRPSAASPLQGLQRR